MKISVIIPVNDLDRRIIKCLDSIYSQDFTKSEYEVLVIFDSCTDDSEAVVREWLSKHQNINMKFFYSDCKTPGGTRNVGLDNASGEYIMFIDGDDYLINNSAMTILYYASQRHNAVRIMDHAVSGTNVKFSNRLTMWLHFFSKELIGNDRFSDMLLNEDFEFVKRVRSKPGYNEAIVTIPLYFYNYDEGRMIERIKKVLSMSQERKAQGLPPLYVDDEFIINNEKKNVIKAQIRRLSGSCSG